MTYNRNGIVVPQGLSLHGNQFVEKPGDGNVLMIMR